MPSPDFSVGVDTNENLHPNVSPAAIRLFRAQTEPSGTPPPYRGPIARVRTIAATPTVARANPTASRNVLPAPSRRASVTRGTFRGKGTPGTRGDPSDVRSTQPARAFVFTYHSPEGKLEKFCELCDNLTPPPEVGKAPWGQCPSIQQLCADERVLWLTVGLEETPDNPGHYHLQGVVSFKKPCRLSGCIGRSELFQQFCARSVDKHLNKEAARAYAKKDGNYFEYEASEATQGQRSDILTCIDSIRADGLHIAVDRHPETFAKYHGGLRFVAKTISKMTRKAPPVIYWFYGATGTGKTRLAYEWTLAHDKSYWISHTDLKWFDGYTGQEVAILDDFRVDNAHTFAQLLRLFDRYTVDVPVKGGYETWLPETIFVTSPQSPYLMFQKHLDASSDGGFNQLTRRVEEFGGAFVRFGPNGEKTRVGLAQMQDVDTFNPPQAFAQGFTLPFPTITPTTISTEQEEPPRDPPVTPGVTFGKKAINMRSEFECLRSLSIIMRPLDVAVSTSLPPLDLAAYLYAVQEHLDGLPWEDLDRVRSLLADLVECHDLDFTVAYISGPQVLSMANNTVNTDSPDADGSDSDSSLESEIPPRPAVPLSWTPSGVTPLDDADMTDEMADILASLAVPEGFTVRVGTRETESTVPCTPIMSDMD